ncbi:MAG: carbohydrate kinase family protein, partial [Promethearchaeota archaeon]
MGREILGLGEVVVDWVALVDHFPEPDEKLDSLSQDLFSGGVTANYIVAASRLGAKTKFFGAVGDDNYGDFLQNDFQKEFINCDYLFRKRGQPTPVNFIFVVEKSGEKVIIQSPYMHTTIPIIADYNRKVLDDIKLLHSTGIYVDLATQAFSDAKTENITTSMDLEKQIAIWGIEKLRPIIQNLDILLPNKMGAMELTHTQNPLDAAKAFLKLGVKKIAITLGSEGAIVVTQDKVIRSPAYKVEPIDTTGAGDTFCAAFGYAHVIKEFSLETSLKFAN